MALQRRDWEQGIFAQAMLEAERRDDLIRLTRAAMVQQTPDGRMAVVASGGPTDPAMGGEAYARAAAWTGDPVMQWAVDAMLDWILHRAPRSQDGTLYHVFGKPEMWSDGLNGAPPFLAAMGHYDEALAQIEGYRKRLWTPEKKLFAHIWDDGQQRLTDSSFWGGGNGWAAAGLARTIRQLPPLASHLDRLRLAGYVRELLDGCLVHQRPDGLFHNIVDQPSTFVETNLAQMLAFTIYTGLAGGWLPAQYRAAADKMRQAARSKMDAEGFVQGVSGAPNFDRPGLSTEGQAFSIMMEAAAQRAN
jgi:rhamnogalacturonyl hydrolase YesR